MIVAEGVAFYALQACSALLGSTAGYISYVFEEFHLFSYEKVDLGSSSLRSTSLFPQRVISISHMMMMKNSVVSRSTWPA